MSSLEEKQSRKVLMDTQLTFTQEEMSKYSDEKRTFCEKGVTYPHLLVTLGVSAKILLVSTENANNTKV